MSQQWEFILMSLFWFFGDTLSSSEVIDTFSPGLGKGSLSRVSTGRKQQRHQQWHQGWASWFQPQPWTLEHINNSTWLGLLGFNASATARVISRRWNDDDEISFRVEETGVPGGNYRPTASNWWNFSHIRPLPSPGIELGPQRCEAKWAKAWCERRLSSPSYRGPHNSTREGESLC